MLAHGSPPGQDTAFLACPAYRPNSTSTSLPPYSHRCPSVTVHTSRPLPPPHRTLSLAASCPISSERTGLDNCGRAAAALEKSFRWARAWAASRRDIIAGGAMGRRPVAEVYAGPTSPWPKLTGYSSSPQVGRGRWWCRVSSVWSGCCKSISWDVAYIAMTIYTCYMRMFSSISGVFRLLFEVFHLDVAKVDLDVAYVAMTKYACFASLCFRCSDVCCKCFVSMFQK
jgi:hypothetical protein